jgi:hypothetical protein
VPQRRVAASILAVVGAVLMPVSLFVDWFRVNTGDSEFDITGWNAFEIADVGLLVASLVAVYAVVLGARRPGAAVSRALLLAGGSALAVIAIQLIDKPPLLGFGLHVTVRSGAVIGLAGAALVFVAGALTALGDRRDSPQAAGL